MNGNVDAEPHAQVPLPVKHETGNSAPGAGTPSPWSAPVSLGAPDDFWRAPDDSSQPVAQLPQDLLSLLRVEATPDDAHGFAQATLPPEMPGTAPLDQLGDELRALVDAGGVESGESCKFELEVPGLGRLSGRIAMRGGQAQLELHAPRQAVAATLRARQQELQRSVDQCTRGEVSLFIV